MRGYWWVPHSDLLTGGTWKERGKQMKDNVILGTALFLALIGAATVLGWVYWAICAIAGA